MDSEGDLFDDRLKPPLQKTSAPRDNEPDELEKLKRWQEERLARKLRGEYESAVLRLTEVVNSNLSTPLRIAAVRVEGAPHTRSSFLGFLINPLLAPAAAETSTLESVLHTTRRISHILQDSDIFSHVEAKIEPSRDPLATDRDVDVVFKTREKGRFYVKTSTEFGNNEGGASATARVRNAFGGAESFEANLSLGTKTRRAYHANLAVPLSPTLRTWADLSVFGLDRDNSSFASCTEGVRGVRAAVRSGTFFSGRHELAYEAVSRHIGSLIPSASISIREAAGETLKSSISHSWTLDTRNDKLAATRGVFLKFFHEFAGLGGDSSFYKTEAEAQCSRPILPGVAVSGAVRAGLLWGIGRPTLLPDRFQLGGPTSVRMFRANSMGPRDGPDSLGGDLYYSAGLSVVSDLPRKPHWPLKLHGFVNAGRLDALDKTKSLQENVVSCITKPAVSVGVGLIYRFDPVRLEVNFGVPLVASKSDGYRRGFQVGMGLDFL